MAIDLSRVIQNDAYGTYRLGRSALFTAGGPPLAEQELNTPADTLGHVLRGDDHQRVIRDVNHDGEFTLADAWQTDKGETLVQSGNFAILIHPGSVSNTFSGGCQTMAAPDFHRFFAALKSRQAHFLYVLVSI